MCGIAVSVRRDRHDKVLISECLQDRICRRGPDGYNSVELVKEGYQITFGASVLHLRGSHGPTMQPISEATQNVLCWNGQVWGGLDGLGGEDVNDGLKLFRALTVSPSDVIGTLSKLKGPWSVVFYEAATQRLYYGRDGLGRRSLLRTTHYDTEGSVSQIVIASVADESKVATEVDATGLYCIELGSLSWETTKQERNIQTGSNDSPMLLSFQRPSRHLPENIPVDRSTYGDYRHKLRLKLEAAIKIRCMTIPNPGDGHPRFAILYSGGLDSAILARLADLVVPADIPIELINIAFENPRLKAKMVNPIEIYSLCPDRVTGLQGFEELKSASYTSRDWRFVEVDVPYHKVEECRSEIIDLMYPNMTEMDLSIAMAFYFASQAEGFRVTSATIRAPYKSSVKVLLSGLGADEQLGYAEFIKRANNRGYNRHVKAYSFGGWEGLLDELTLDLERISERNMGRDDRVIAHHGREARYPFLDENVIEFLSRVPVYIKADPRLGGDGMKIILRELARDLGLERTYDNLHFCNSLQQCYGKEESHPVWCTYSQDGDCR